MSETDRETRERTRYLMMAALDGELEAELQAELDRLLDADPDAQAEWDKLRRVREVTRTMGYSEPPEEVWDDYWTSVYNRVERGVGWILVSVGALLLFAYAAWHWVQRLLADSGLPGFVRIAIFAVVLGGAIVFVSVLREKLFVRRSDRYRKVLR